MNQKAKIYVIGFTDENITTGHGEGNDFTVVCFEYGFFYSPSKAEEFIESCDRYEELEVLTLDLNKGHTYKPSHVPDRIYETRTP